VVTAAQLTAAQAATVALLEMLMAAQAALLDQAAQAATLVTS
jgi:hypothetical protein